MELRQLRTFQTVAKLLSFKGAAEQLNYAQSSISAQIQALEEDLGVRLFDRLGRRIMLTEAGERLRHYADKMMALEAETRAEMTGGCVPQGTLTIRVPDSMGTIHLPPIIRKFQHQFPQVGLNLTTCAHEGLQQDLRKGITDLAFLYTESIQAADLEVVTLGFESIIMVAAPDHPLARTEQMQLTDLAGEAMLFSRVDCSYRKSVERMLADAGVTVARPVQFHSVAALKACLAQGLGIAMLPLTAVAQELDQGRLIRLPWDQRALEVAVLMIWYKARWLSPTLQAFIKTTNEAFQVDPHHAVAEQLKPRHR